MQIRLVIHYKTKQGIEAMLESAEIDVEKAILVAEDMLKTGRVKSCDFFDATNQSWTLKQLKKYIEKVSDEPHHITIYFDGGFDVKTGTAGLGCVIYYEQNNKRYRHKMNAQIQEIGTNNEAEYAALHYAVKELDHMNVHHLPVTFIGDSKVVINQMDDVWPCYETQLTSWIDRIEGALEKLGIDPNYEAVSRKQNKIADQLATQALQGIDISSTIEIT